MPQFTTLLIIFIPVKYAYVHFLDKKAEALRDCMAYSGPLE